MPVGCQALLRFLLLLQAGLLPSSARLLSSCCLVGLLKVLLGHFTPVPLLQGVWQRVSISFVGNRQWDGRGSAVVSRGTSSGVAGFQQGVDIGVPHGGLTGGRRAIDRRI